MSLPRPLVQGAGYTPGENTVRTSMDAGRAKMRRRFTAVCDSATYQIVVTEAQLQTLEDFVDITLQGVLPFDWEDFRRPRGTPATYRFVQRPAYAPHRSGIRWIATLKLDVLKTSSGHFLLGSEAQVPLVDGSDVGLTT